MTKQRTYKTLTKSQTSKVRKYTKAGKSQQAIAKLLGVSKQRVSTAQAKAKVGKRVASPFWREVKKVREITGISHKEATRVVYHAPKWGKRRIVTRTRGKLTGEGYLSPEQRYAAMKAKRAEFDTGTLNREQTAEMKAYGDEIGLGDTPK